MIRLTKRSLALVLVSLLGCGNGTTSRDSGVDGSVAGSDSSCIAGTRGCRCNESQSCGDSLVCVSQICLESGGSGGSGGVAIPDGAVGSGGSVGGGGIGGTISSGGRDAGGMSSGDGAGGDAGGMSSSGGTGRDGGMSSSGGAGRDGGASSSGGVGRDGGASSSGGAGSDAGGLSSSGGTGRDAARDTIGGLDAATDSPAIGGRCQTLRVAPEQRTDHVKVVDLDGDGHLDVVTADDDGAIKFYRGTGRRVFEAPIAFPVIPSDLDFLAVGHLDGDGHLDIATTRMDSDPYILLSTGPATFGPAIKLLNVGTQTPPLPRSGWDIDIVDLDVDGSPDVVTTDAEYARFDVYWGDGSGSFGPAVALHVPGQPVTTVFGDFNEDGRPDAVVANLKVSATLIPMGADRLLQTPLAITAFDAWEAAIGDFNRDGHLDVAFPEQAKGDVIVRLGDGKGGLSVPTTKPPALEKGLWSIAIADFDGDGFPDLAVGNGDKKDVAFLRGDGTGKFGTATHVATAWSARNLDAGDLDHDGFADLVAPEWDQGFTVIFGPCP